MRSNITQLMIGTAVAIGKPTVRGRCECDRQRGCALAQGADPGHRTGTPPEPLCVSACWKLTFGSVTVSSSGAISSMGRAINSSDTRTPSATVRLFEGTLKNRRLLLHPPKLPANDSVSFSFQFIGNHSPAAHHRCSEKNFAGPSSEIRASAQRRADAEPANLPRFLWGFSGGWLRLGPRSSHYARHLSQRHLRLRVLAVSVISVLLEFDLN